MDVNQEGDVINISVKVKNNGTLAGKEVVQIYISKPDTKIDRPVQELKAFAKTPLLNGGESAVLTMKIAVSDLSYWNEEEAKWTLESGVYSINAGSSSRDIRLTGDIEL